MPEQCWHAARDGLDPPQIAEIRQVLQDDAERPRFIQRNHNLEERADG